jgi:hypothetical protein
VAIPFKIAKLYAQAAPEKAQQLPHVPWSLTGVTTF